MRFKALVRKFYQRYLLDAMSAMALGLFASLIIGLILTQLSMIPALKFLADYGEIVSASSPVVGAAIGVAIAYGLKVAPLAMFSSAATGALGYQLGGPGRGAYFAAVVGAELGNLVSGKTKVDIIVVPIVSIVSGCFIATWSAPGINNAVAALQRFLEMATTLQPIPMGIIVSVVFGLALTAPISSAALAAMVFTVAEGEVMGEGLLLAAGAATAGCCAQMVGFAVASYREKPRRRPHRAGHRHLHAAGGQHPRASGHPPAAHHRLGHHRPPGDNALSNEEHLRLGGHGYLRPRRPVRHLGGDGRGRAACFSRYCFCTSSCPPPSRCSSPSSCAKRAGSSLEI